MQTGNEMINYSTSTCPFESGSVCKGREKITKNFYIVFEGLSFGEKNNN